MSITDELREYADGFSGPFYGQGERLRKIADRIDAAHRSALEKLAAQVDESEDGWVRLPVDADGVPIRVGDVVEFIGKDYAEEVISITFTGYCWWVETNNEKDKAEYLRHHHAPTVEDVLREFAHEIDADAYGITDAKVAEYAAKLRLAEGVEV